MAVLNQSPGLSTQQLQQQIQALQNARAQQQAQVLAVRKPAPVNMSVITPQPVLSTPQPAPGYSRAQFDQDRENLWRQQGAPSRFQSWLDSNPNISDNFWNYYAQQVRNNPNAGDITQMFNDYVRSSRIANPENFNMFTPPTFNPSPDLMARLSSDLGKKYAAGYNPGVATSMLPAATTPAPMLTAPTVLPGSNGVNPVGTPAPGRLTNFANMYNQYSGAVPTASK